MFLIWYLPLPTLWQIVIKYPVFWQASLTQKVQFLRCLIRPGGGLIPNETLSHSKGKFVFDYGLRVSLWIRNLTWIYIPLFMYDKSHFTVLSYKLLFWSCNEWMKDEWMKDEWIFFTFLKTIFHFLLNASFLGCNWSQHPGWGDNSF